MKKPLFVMQKKTEDAIENHFDDLNHTSYSNS